MTTWNLTNCHKLFKTMLNYLIQCVIKSYIWNMPIGGPDRGALWWKRSTLQGQLYLNPWSNNKNGQMSAWITNRMVLSLLIKITPKLINVRFSLSITLSSPQFFGFVDEAVLAVEVMKAVGLPVALTMRIGPSGDFSGFTPEECAVKIAKAGWDIIERFCHT